MRKGIYAFLKENSNGTMNIDIEYGNDKILASISNLYDKTISEPLSRHLSDYKELENKSRLVGHKRKLLDGIVNICSKDEFIRLVGMLAKTCKKSGLDLFVFQDNKMIYTTDKLVSIVKDDSKALDLKSLNRAAMESLVRSYK